MRHALLLTTLAAFSPLWADNTAAPEPTTPEERARRGWERFNTAAIVANVDGEAITAQEVRRMLAGVIPQLRQEAKTDEEFHRKMESLHTELLNQLTNNMLIIRDAKERGMQFPKSVVDAEVDEKITREFGGDRAEYLRQLRLMGKTPLDDRLDIERKITVDYLSAQVRKAVGELSPDKINRFYESNKDGFKQEAAVKVSQIALWADATETDEDVRKRAADICARLDKGEAFADLAKRYSKDDYREQGGDAGWKELGSLSEAIAKELNKLGDGAHTAPVEFKTGGRVSFYILRREAYRAEGPRPVNEVREIIEGKLMVDATRTAMEDWYQRLRDRFFVRYY